MFDPPSNNVRNRLQRSISKAPSSFWISWRSKRSRHFGVVDSLIVPILLGTLYIDQLIAGIILLEASTTNRTHPPTPSRYTCAIFIQQSDKIHVYRRFRQGLQQSTIEKQTQSLKNRQLRNSSTNVAKMHHTAIQRFSCSRHTSAAALVIIDPLDKSSINISHKRLTIIGTKRELL